jgi:mono/diheme cytochrome c family protein
LLLGRLPAWLPALLPFWLRAPFEVLLLLAGALASAHAQPARLSETGLYASVSPQRLVPDVIAFAPQHVLWSDGASKRRWLRLPPGTFIDARAADAWVFPRGTRLWKEFAFGGRAVETRFIELGRDGRWRFATYVWRADGSDADRVPERGDVVWAVAGTSMAAVPFTSSTSSAPSTLSRRYALPSVADCRACHESSAVPVLGFSALQLSSAREGPTRLEGGLDLRELVARRLVRHLDPALLAPPPRTEGDAADERAALGYLHANCGHCHNRSDQRVPLPLTLALRAGDAAVSRSEVLASTRGAASRFRAHAAAPNGPDADPIVRPGDAARSLLVQRMASRDPRLQMPPLGTTLVDAEGLRLVERWIANDAPTPTSTVPTAHHHP